VHGQSAIERQRGVVAHLLVVEQPHGAVRQLRGELLAAATVGHCYPFMFRRGTPALMPKKTLSRPRAARSSCCVIACNNSSGLGRSISLIPRPASIRPLMIVPHRPSRPCKVPPQLSQDRINTAIHAASCFTGSTNSICIDVSISRATSYFPFDSAGGIALYCSRYLSRSSRALATN